MTKKEIIEQKKADLVKRNYKRFHTTLDENILKEIKINAVKMDMNANQIIELMYDFTASIDEEVMLEMLEESLEKNCKCGDLIAKVWKEHKKKSMEEEKC